MTALRLRATVAAALAVVVAMVGALAPAVASASPPVEGERLVVRVGDTVRPGSVADSVDGEVGDTVAPDTFVVEVAPDDVTGALRELERRDDVAWVERDADYRSAVIPDDVCWVGCGGARQSALEVVGAPRAWDVSIGSPSVRVAVLDTGVDARHPDLIGKVDVGPSFSTLPATCAAPQLTSQRVHGTSVASIVAASTNNAVGLAGMGWSTRVLAIRVLNDCGQGKGSEIAAGIRAAVDAGAPIINLSLAGGHSRAVEEAVAHARRRGVLVVAAAGNEGSTTPTYPAAFDGVVGVGSTGADDRIGSFSNRGPWVSLLAPGDGLVVAHPGGGYGRATGTSFSAPLVSGTAALLLADRPGAGAEAIRSRLLRTATPIAGTGTVVRAGRLDAGAALTAADAGYWLVSTDGTVQAVADAPGLRSPEPSQRTIVGVAGDRRGGLWLAASDGTVVRSGSSRLLGSARVPAVKPIVDISATPTGAGYRLVGSDGGVFTFGDAGFFGSTASRPLNSPIVAVAATPSGDGYWLVAADGGVFSFGDARFHGSAGRLRLRSPIVGVAATPSGDGYWLVAADGGVFSFGDAGYHGSAGDLDLRSPVVDMVASPSGQGYWLAAADGGVFAFGDAPFLGSAPGSRAPVVGLVGL